jgi:hypothetical protein
MSTSKPSNLIEVYEIEAGKNRPGYGHKPGALEFLPADAPMPEVGDIILLPRACSGDSQDQAFFMGLCAPFRVVEREFLYFRDLDEKHDPINTKPARYLKTWIHVRRLSEDEYEQAPGRLPASR